MSKADAEILVGVDGGGTACRFALSHAGRRVEHRAGPANVYSDFPAALETLTAGLDALAVKAGLSDLTGARLYLGLAGVTGAKMAEKVAAALPYRNVTVADDRLTAVTGALASRDGAVIGIGTGSFLARKSGDRVTMMGGWGFVLGDEASGAWLGRRLLQHVLHVADGLAPATGLTEAALQQLGGIPAGLVDIARAARPAHFAALVDKTVSNMQEVMARNGKVVLVTDRQGAETARDGTWMVLEMPDVPPLLAPILYAVPAQLLAYHTAIAKGTDVDQPRNLAKSVTVE